MEHDLKRVVGIGSSKQLVDLILETIAKMSVAETQVKLLKDGPEYTNLDGLTDL